MTGRMLLCHAAHPANQRSHMDTMLCRARPEAGRQVCASCNSSNVRRTIVTLMAVYFRCADCGVVWSIPNRRSIPRLNERIER